MGSRELWFTPDQICGGNVEAVIETAGSIPMLLLAVLPICIFAEKPVHLHVAKGGTDTTHAPTINYMRHVFLPTLRLMSVDAQITVQKFGYYPKGGGEATMTVTPNRKLKPFELLEYGKLESIKGVSVCTFLADRQVAERQAQAAQNYLSKDGHNSSIEAFNDESNPYQKGSSIVLWAQTNTGAILGADAIGELRKMSEEIGKDVARRLSTELFAQPTVDVYLADMLIPYMAMTDGKSAFLVRVISEHIESNIWLIEKMLNVKFTIQKVNNLYKIEKSS